eukprot:1356863-Amorphochlora_amoeboformis.AAC.1
MSLPRLETGFRKRLGFEPLLLRGGGSSQENLSDTQRGKARWEGEGVGTRPSSPRKIIVPEVVICLCFVVNCLDLVRRSSAHSVVWR